LTKVRDEASELDIGVHIHLAESKEMVKWVKEKYGLTEVELLESLGFLKLDVLAAHCIYLSEDEMRLMAKRDVKVSYNPVVNMKIALGVPRIRDLMGFGVTVGIGTDGPASNNDLDMFDDMRVAALLQKVFYMDSTVLPARRVLGMATIGGARALGLEGSVGSLEVGKKADIVLVDFGKPHLTPVHDFYANMVYSARGSDVETVIVDGRVLMEGGMVMTLDEEEVRLRAGECALDLLAR
jgi:5-methylthioadenosine/S-adenosylhomocysteine deaminase